MYGYVVDGRLSSVRAPETPELDATVAPPVSGSGYDEFAATGEYMYGWPLDGVAASGGASPFAIDIGYGFAEVSSSVPRRRRL